MKNNNFILLKSLFRHNVYSYKARFWLMSFTLYIKIWSNTSERISRYFKLLYNYQNSNIKLLYYITLLKIQVLKFDDYIRCIILFLIEARFLSLKGELDAACTKICDRLHFIIFLSTYIVYTWKHLWVC